MVNRRRTKMVLLKPIEEIFNQPFLKLSTMSLFVSVSRSVPDIKSGPVFGRISEKYPIRYPAGLLAESGWTNILANELISLDFLSFWAF